MLLQRLPHDALVLPQQLPRFRVAEAVGERRGALDIREQDGAESTRLPYPGLQPQEPVYLRDYDVGLSPGGGTLPFERDEPGLGKPRR